ncbi:MAG: hypothetical protein ACM3S2_09640 [Ignavibacteriales bacterium]
MYPKFKYIYVLIAILSSLFLYACSEDPTSAGLSLLNNGDIITINADSSIQTQSAEYLKTDVKLTYSNRVLLGRYGNVRSSFLLQFNLSSVLPDSIKKELNDGTLTVSYAKIQMSPVYTLGNSTSFDFLVHKVNNLWSSNYTADSLSKLSYDAANMKIKNDFNDSLYTIELDNNKVLSWFSDSNYVNKNYGMYFEPANNVNKIVGFQAIASSPAKSLMSMTVVFNKPGKYIDTLTFSPMNDVHMVSGTLPVVNNTKLVVQGGISVSSRFQVLLPSIPETAIINSAILQLTIDSTSSVLGNPSDNSLIVKFLTDKNSTAYDTLRTTVLYKSGNVFSGNITAHLQRWINKEPNYGLMISSGNADNNVDLFAFREGTAANGPKLKILYTTKRK